MNASTGRSPGPAPAFHARGHGIWEAADPPDGLPGCELGGSLGVVDLPDGYAFHSTPRLLIAGLVALIGAVNLLDALFHRASAVLVSWPEPVAFPVLHGTRAFVALAGLCLILLGHGLLHGRRAAWLAALLLLAGVAIAHLPRGFDPDASGITVGGIALLLWRRRDFRARPDLSAIRDALRLAASALLLLVVCGALGAAALHAQLAPAAPTGPAVRQALARMALMAGPLAGATRTGRWFVDSLTLAWGGLLTFAAFAVLLPARHPLPDTPTDRARARALLRHYGTATTSYMTTWPGNAILLQAGRDAYLAYRLIGGVALVLGDPVGTPEGCIHVIDEFLDLAARNGWTPCIYAATRLYLAAYARRGLTALQVGEDAVIDLPSLAFRGRAWQDVRTALNRARREGVEFRLIHQVGADPGLLRQLRAISRDWMAEKRLPEMGFTLGTLADPPDPEVRTAVAVDAAGQVLAFATWLPVYAGGGWAIDMMRRRADAFPGVMEFLIARSALEFQAEGARFVSLSAAPLAGLSRATAGRAAERALVLVASRLDALYSFGTLAAFKRKFQPRWEPLYLVHPGAASLPRIGYAILRAYLPGLSREEIRRLLAGAVDLVPARPWARGDLDRAGTAPTEWPQPVGVVDTDAAD